MRETYEKVKGVIGLDFESSKFQGFLDYIEKINDFQVNIESFSANVLTIYREASMNVKMRMKS